MILLKNLFLKNSIDSRIGLAYNLIMNADSRIESVNIKSKDAQFNEKVIKTMTFQETLRGPELHTVATETATAHELGLYMAQRERNRTEIDVDRLIIKLLRDGKKIVAQDAIKFFERLEGLKAGALVYPRNKAGSIKFNCHYSIKDMGQAMIDGNTNKVIERFQAKAPAKAAPKAEQPKPKTVVNRTQNRVVQVPSSTRVVVVLGSGREVQINLPADLNKQEAQTICNSLLKASA